MRILHSKTYSSDDEEAFWRTQYSWLARRGYELRPKYMTTWASTSTTAINRRPIVPGLEQSGFIDAIRTADGTSVVLKRIHADTSHVEFNLSRYFSTLRPSLRNHCTPILEILPVPADSRAVLVVMPLLKSFDEPQFKTLGEAVAFFTQIFEGLHFMHETVGIIHGQISYRHIMMDAAPLYPHAYDPVYPAMRRDWKGRARPRARTVHPVRYYFIDFAHASSGRDWNRPAIQEQYAADVYNLGEVLRTNFFNKYDGLEFMYPILADMLEPDSTKRPSAERLYAHFLKTRSQLSPAKLRARLVERGGEPFLTAVYRSWCHWVVTMRRRTSGVPAVPDA